MSGAIAQRANETTKALGGKVSYLWATFAVFAKWQNSELRLTVDEETRIGRMHDVVVANGKTFGGGMIICPDAEPDDGLFDVLTIGDLTKRDLLVTLPKTYRGSHLPHPKAELLRGSVVTVDADAPLPIELDGEQPGTTPVRFEVVPRALRLRVRRSRPAGLRRGAACARQASSCRLLRRRAHLLLERRHPLLELVEATQFLLHLVEPRLRLVHHVDDLRATGHVREPVQRLVAELGEAGEDVVLLVRARFCVVLVFAIARSYPVRLGRQRACRRALSFLRGRRLKGREESCGTFLRLPPPQPATADAGSITSTADTHGRHIDASSSPSRILIQPISP